MRILIQLVIVLLCLSNPWMVLARQPTIEKPGVLSVRSDSQVLHQLFGESLLAENAAEVCRRADKLSPEERYEFLVRWVLPNERHSTFRLNGDYFPGSPAPPIKPDFSEESDRLNDLPILRYLALRETLALPAFELIKAAILIDRLDQIRELILAVSPTNVEQRRSRAAMLFVVEVARGDRNAATAAFQQLTEELRISERSELSASWRDLLVMWTVLAYPDARRMVGDYFFSFYEDMTEYYPDQRFDVMMDYLRATQGLYYFLELQTEQSSIAVDASEPDSFWLPYSFTSAFSRGHGRPRAVWSLQPGKIRKLVGHEQDYLSYRIPLRGNYEVECDVTTGPSLNGSLMVAGTHVEYISQTNSIRTGNFRKKYQDLPLTPQLTAFDSTVHHRAVVQDNTLTHYINGRQVLQKRLAPHHDPWIAIKSWRRSQGGLNNLRITGDTEIPEEIQLVGDPDADGWSPYYGESFGINEGSWGVVREPRGGYGLLGVTQAERASATIPKLLRYHRPIVEDGTINYDFFYLEGKSCVHPAIDRMALMIAPEGISLHWITDGIYDRSELDPRNQTVEPDNRRGPDRLPLIEGDWNRIALRFEGDKVLMSLNGQLIYERTLEPENRRTFGLFYYSDQTEAYVRNALWRGNWPKKLPTADEQSPSNLIVRELDDSREELPEVFRHDFREQLLPELFVLEGEESFLQHPDDGLRLLRGGPAGMLSLRACLQIGGDFDIIAGFHTFDYNLPVATDHVGLGLMTVLNNASQDTCAVYRRCERGNWNQLASFTHEALRDDGSDSSFRKDLIEDGFSGRLRLARRGNVLYGLFAESDSKIFRLISQRNVPPDEVDAQGLRLVTQCGKDQGLGVTLKDLEIRAERMYGLPVRRSAPLVALLNGNRNKSVREQLNLQDAELFARKFLRLGEADHDRKHSPEGMRLTLRSLKDFELLRYRTRPEPRSIVDLEARLKIHQLDKPPVLERHSEITLKSALQPRTENQSGTIEAELVVRQKALGERQLVAQVYQIRRGNRVNITTIRTVMVKSPDLLRLALHEDKLYFLYSEEESDEIEVLAEYRIPAQSTLSDCQLTLAATGKSRTTDVTWKSISISHRE